MRDVGCLDHRLTASRRITLDNPEVEAKIGMINFYSVTVRAFKLAAMEDLCEDYGQVASYRETIPDWPHHFDMGDHHRFPTGKPLLVCGNTAAMLQETRYHPHFTVQGNRSIHFGPFDCAPAVAKINNIRGVGGACC